MFAAMPALSWSRTRTVDMAQTMEKSMGERRLTYHAPVGISVCEPLDIAGVMGDASAPADALSLVQHFLQLYYPQRTIL